MFAYGNSVHDWLIQEILFDLLVMGRCGQWWTFLGRCGLLWILFESLWVAVKYVFGSLWVVPWFTKAVFQALALMVLEWHQDFKVACRVQIWKKYFVKIVARLVIGLLKWHFVHVFTLYLQKTHYFNPI